ncbi:MAG: hypothetical protein COA78_10210 [Blastopirellula sp.]|nr:MAG: hypothetical protein COA78_10210 [Blastopirellula sp.]
MIRFLSSLVLIAGSLFFVPDQALAINEAETLALLVDTIDNTDDPAVQAALMKGMLSAMAGRRNVAAPNAWSKVATKLGKSEGKEVKDFASQLSQIFGDKAAVEQALATVQDSSASLAERRRALHSLLSQQNDQVSALLEPLLAEPAMRLDAIRGFSAIENGQASKLLLAGYKNWSEEHQKAVVETLATRKVYAEALLDAIKKKQITKQQIPVHVARSLSFLLGDSFAKVFGEVRQLSQDRTKLIAKYKKLLTPSALEKADPAKGRVLYNKTCANCHTLYGTGGKIGPELTGSNRANLDYILLNSVDPSYDVPAGYRMVIIQTVDGRVLDGVIAEENAQRVILKTVQQPTVVILKSDIENRKVSTKSMMPDAQLDQMKPQEVINLIKYLQTTEQVELPQ